MAEATFKSMIEQMEARAQTLYVKMEGFREIQMELHTLTKAIKIMKGEKLTPGNPGSANGHKSKQQLLAERLPDMDSESVVSGPRSSKNEGIVEDLQKILKSRPKGMTIKEMDAELARLGHEITIHTSHNALRTLKSKVVGAKGLRKIYALTKET